MEDKFVLNERGNWVKKTQNNMHKEHCICWNCRNFNHLIESKGCEIIKQVLTLAEEKEIVLPVWECKNFSEKA